MDVTVASDYDEGIATTTIANLRKPAYHSPQIASRAVGDPSPPKGDNLRSCPSRRKRHPPARDLLQKKDSPRPCYRRLKIMQNPYPMTKLVLAESKLHRAS